MWALGTAETQALQDPTQGAVTELMSKNGKVGGLGLPCFASPPGAPTPALRPLPSPSAFSLRGEGVGQLGQGCHSSVAHRMSGGSGVLGSPLPVRLWPAWTL